MILATESGSSVDSVRSSTGSNEARETFSSTFGPTVSSPLPGPVTSPPPLPDHSREAWAEVGLAHLLAVDLHGELGREDAAGEVDVARQVVGQTDADAE